MTFDDERLDLIEAVSAVLSLKRSFVCFDVPMPDAWQPLGVVRYFGEGYPFDACRGKVDGGFGPA